MSDFNRMTLVAAAEVVADFHSHSDMDVLELQWGVSDRCGGSSKSARIANLAAVAIVDDAEVFTESGRMPISRALVEAGILAPPKTKISGGWRKFIAGLRFDGFEIVESEIEIEGANAWSVPTMQRVTSLVRMLPSDVPGLDFRDAENEVAQLLGKHRFSVAKGHLTRAISAFQRGEWSSANGELRNLYESYLNEIADRLGGSHLSESRAKRDFLGELRPPFLLSEYNEWNANNQKPQYVQALLSRMHPHGGHPGLSEEEDATFRLQVTLVTARLFLRRFDQRGSDG
jgi:hypothetical protein